MHQQNPIVIDFQEIFKDQQPKQQSSLLSTSLDHSLSQTITFNRNQCFTIAEETHNTSQYASRTRQSISKSHLNMVSAPQQLQNLKKLIEQKQGQSSANKTHHVDIIQLTNRLHNSSLCKKEQCSRHRSIKQIKDFEDSLPINKQLKNKSNSSASLNKPYAFERLHNLSKLQQLRKTYQLTDTTEKTNKSPKKEHSLSKSAHLKKYIPFYSRLQDEVNKSQQRIKIMQNNPQFATGHVEKFFKPRLIPNKYSQVSSRYNEGHKNNQLQNCMNISLSSSISSIDRSLDIVTRIQEHFYHKMKYIFAKNNEEAVKIDQNAIKLLTEEEFTIMQGFLVELQSNAVKATEFTDKLRDYYNNLPTDQKRALRNHEARETNKYRQIRKKLSKDKKEAITKPATISTVNKKVKKPQGNYHSKIKAYI